MGPSGLDPRRNNQGLIRLQLTQQSKSYAKEDPPPERVKPIPIQIVEELAQTLEEGTQQLATRDLVIVGFFFMLRPGEYTHATKYHAPFRLQDLSFSGPDGTINAAVISPIQMSEAQACHLLFTTQKNGTKGQTITHGHTPDPLVCPLKALTRRVCHLRAHNAPPDTPLHQYYHPEGTANITTKDITASLRKIVKLVGPSLNIYPKDVSARALRAGGAMALLRAGIDPVDIRLQGRWKSWAMMEYLHKDAVDTTPFASAMLHHGHYQIAAHAALPKDILDWLSTTSSALPTLSTQPTHPALLVG